MPRPVRVPARAAVALCAAIVAAGACGVPTAAAGDAISPLVQSVSDDSVLAHVLWIEGYITRRADMPQAAQAAAWIAARFRSWGADSVFVHAWTAAYAPNVVGIRRGTTRPHRIVVVGGHFDSITPMPQTAPGADDNASGTAGVLESARVLCSQRFEYTLQFVAFSAEELGLVGSNAYAAHLAAGGDSVVAMLNLDMIGYVAPRDRRDVDIISTSGSDWLRDLAKQTTATYVPNLPAVDGAYPTSARSDQQSFWAHGFSAISFYEDSDSSPFIHTANDVFGTSFNDLELAARITRAAVALLASLARPVATPVAVEELAARRVESGVELTWRLADPGAFTAVGVQRAASALGPWIDATRHPLVPQRTMRWVDTDPTGATWYRLALHTGRGTIELSSPIAVGATPSLAAASLLPPVDRGDVGVDVRWSIGMPSRASLAVFDARGRRVRLLAAGPRDAGHYVTTWDRRDDAGLHAARGVYFVHLQAGGAAATRKVAVARD